MSFKVLKSYVNCKITIFDFTFFEPRIKNVRSVSFNIEPCATFYHSVPSRPFAIGKRKCVTSIYTYLATGWSSDDCTDLNCSLEVPFAKRVYDSYEQAYEKTNTILCVFCSVLCKRLPWYMPKGYKSWAEQSLFRAMCLKQRRKRHTFEEKNWSMLLRFIEIKDIKRNREQYNTLYFQHIG